MSFIDRVAGLTYRAEAEPRVNEERLWTGGPVYGTSTGITVTPMLALQVSCLFHGVRLIAETLGSLPLILYRERGDGGKERAKTDPLWDVLRRRPNQWQTAQQWRETNTARAILWGSGLNEIIPGRRGAVEELRPLDPTWVTTEQIADSGRLRFRVQEPGKAPRVLVQDQVFRVDGLAIHQFIPSNLLVLAREAIGLWLAQEKFASLFFAQGAKPTLLLKHPQELSPTAWQRLQGDMGRMYGGLRNAHKVLLLEEGLDVAQQAGFNARDSQMTESREAQVHEIARWLNIPVHMFRAGDQPTFASVEQFAREYIDYTIRPWCTRWEGSIDRDLLTAEDVYAEHLLDALLRGSTLERAQAYAVFIQNGIMSENEVRLRENLNPVPGLDEPRRSANQDRGADPGTPTPTPPPPRRKKAPADAATPHLVTIARGAAQRVVRKEVAAVRTAATKHAADPAAWGAWLDDFYARHAALVAETLEIGPAATRSYVDAHRDRLAVDGAVAAVDWERTGVEDLLALVGIGAAAQGEVDA